MGNSAKSKLTLPDESSANAMQCTVCQPISADVNYGLVVAGIRANILLLQFIAVRAVHGPNGPWSGPVRERTVRSFPKLS